MLDIRIKTVPERLIRNEQSGDWEYDDKQILSTVLENTYSPESELAIAIHELIEAWLCRRDKVTNKAVLLHDEIYERARKMGLHPETTEPGDAEDSPYRLQHQAATHVERAVIAALGVRWEDHEKEITNSGQPRAEISTAEDHLKIRFRDPAQTEPGLLPPLRSLSEDQPSNP